MKLGNEEKILELLKYSIIRLDGAWFLNIAHKYGAETAWNTDVEAWKQFSYLFGKKIRNDYIEEPVWPQSYIEMLEIFFEILTISGRELIVKDNLITVRVTACETQKAIAKADIADCGIVTVHVYQGLASGLYGKEFKIDVQHTKNLNHGDPYCEVVIKHL